MHAEDEDEGSSEEVRNKEGEVMNLLGQFINRGVAYLRSLEK